MKNNYLWAILAFVGAGAATYLIVKTTTKDKREDKARKIAKGKLAQSKNNANESSPIDSSPKRGVGGFLSDLFGGIGESLDFTKSQADAEGYERYVVNTTSTSLNIRQKPSSTSTIVGSLKKNEYFYGKPSGAFIEVFNVNISKAEPEYTSRGFVSASFAKKG